MGLQKHVPEYRAWRVQSLAAGVHKVNIFKSTYSETARKSAGGHQMK